MDKIKGQMGIDSTTLICLLVVVLVGLSSFGLGRLSVSNIGNDYISELNNINTSIVKEEIGNRVEAESSLNNEDDKPRERMYVASKNGKLYYGATCTGAKRISLKNEVWFASSIEAEKAGYELSSSCK